jgi:hypothetical protein
MKYIMLGAMFLFSFGCAKEDEPLTVSEQHGQVGIYFLEDSTLTGSQAAKMDINQLDLKKKPWVSNDDIQFYDYSSHCIYLKGDKSQFFENDTGNFFMFSPVVIDKPFVVVANGEKCYVGSFHSLLLSTAPSGPYMDEMDVGYFPKDVMHISRSWSSIPDMRNNSNLRDALITLGLYHGGISITLRSAAIIENSDTSTVEYAFILINNDQDNLYVIDPDKMGIDLFHYFTNGIVLQAAGALFQSEYKKTQSPSVSYDASWFTLVPINSSIERTVKLRGYQKIISGSYNCSFTFANPNVEKANRYLTGGRIWLGSVASSTITIEAK